MFIQQDGWRKGKVGRDKEICITDEEQGKVRHDKGIGITCHDIEIGVTGGREKVRDTRKGITGEQGKVCHDKGNNITGIDR